MNKLDPLLAALSGDPTILPSSQSIANAAIIAVFAYLVPLLTMEINFFRLAVYKSWRRSIKKRKEEELGEECEGGDGEGRNDKNGSGNRGENGDVGDARGEQAAMADGDDNDGNNAMQLTPLEIEHTDNNHNNDDSFSSSSSSSAVGHLLNDIATALHDTAEHNKHSRSTTNNNNLRHRHSNDPSLQTAYQAIRTSSFQAILSSLIIYSLTAAGIALSTRGLDPKVVAIITGASQFITALMVFIVSAKVPQWIGVYHQGAIRLVKCSSNYSQHFERINLHDPVTLQKLRSNVRLGVWFHFSKFYILLMPFYCGVQRATIPLSIVSGGVFGFILMWAVFVVHENYIHHRNIVSFTTIILLSIISALTLVRGMAWIQVVWQLDILPDEDLLLVISFFTWLGLLALVHALFIWHTLRTEERKGDGTGGNAGINNTEETDGINNSNNENGLNDESGHGSKVGKNPKAMRRNSSYSSFVFDPRTHFVDGKCQFSEHPDVHDDLSSNNSTDALLSDVSPVVVVIPGGGDGQSSPGVEKQEEDFGYSIETPVVADDTGDDFAMEFDKTDDINNNDAADAKHDVPIVIKEDDLSITTNKRHCCCRSSWCEVFICFSPEYKQSSCLWKFLIWTKITVIAFAYLLCIYFVIVSIGATAQIASTKAGLPAVHEALYNHMNEGPVCAFDNRGPDSNITTFANKEAAHDAGFLVAHCGACGACSNWENLIIEYTTRDNMAALANQCAKEALFGGGDDALTACLMKPEIGFGHDCAVCWMEDIVCTKEHCVFIFLQSQMTNNVGNFAVGEDEITSASCEEAHCEVGQFVPCSGATRRRMNITSSISRPGDQQCAIVDVKDWGDLFFGSGVA